MAVAQDTFQLHRDIAYPGQISTTDVMDVESKAVETAAVAFGSVVQYGTAADSCIPASATATAANVLGFAVRSMGVENNSSGVAEYAVGETASILKRGKLYATCKNGAAAGASVFLVKATAGGDAIGDLRGTSDTTNTIELTGCKWINTVAAGKIGEIDVKLI